MRLNATPQSRAAVLEEGEPLPPDDAIVSSRPGRHLELLYRKHKPRLLRFLERRGGPDQAADIVQRLFTKLARADAVPPPAIKAPDAYLNQAAQNLLRDDARAAERRSAHLHSCLEDVTLVAPDPVAALEARDMLQRLEAIVAKLPARTREIFLAHRIDGFSYAEIAFRTGLSVKTVEKHMSRAIARIGRDLGR